jgi:hypothetical protein
MTSPNIAKINTLFLSHTARLAIVAWVRGGYLILFQANFPCDALMLCIPQGKMRVWFG